MPVLTLLAIVLLAANLFTLLILIIGALKMKDLAHVDPVSGARQPLVSIIVPACNEEATIEPALRSLLQQDYPNLEIIVIDDRSTDGTLHLLQRMQRKFPRIRIRQIQELPQGWLGKNHALQTGADMARGEILLFTDADVIMEPTTLSRAVHYCTDNQLDHLTLIFRNTSCNGLLNAMVVDTFAGLFVLLRPWQVHNPNSRAFIGVGAFNMISVQAYRQLGGHGSLKMHPIDDVMLGKKVKQLGLHQDCLLGGKFVQVRWYGTVGEMNRGLLKNIFALYGYRISCALTAIAGIIVMTIVPPWGMLLAGETARILFSLTLLCRLAVFSITARMIQLRPIPLLWSFLTPYLIVRIIVTAIRTTIGNQGIEWRGTRYSLGELKKQEALFTWKK